MPTTYDLPPECHDCGTTDDLCSGCGYCVCCQDVECAVCGQPAPPLPPEPTEPRFKVGDPVWAVNGEPRIVTGMAWCQARRRNGERQRDQGWGWALDTVHPDDPECKGAGFEWCYRRREV